jgi:phosphotransacetylase
MIASFSQLHERTASKSGESGMSSIGIVWPNTPEHFEAIKKCAEKGYIAPILIGPEEEIGSLAAGISFDISPYKTIGADTVETALDTVSNLHSHGRIDSILNCGIKSRLLIDWLQAGISSLADRKARLSHIGLIETDRYHKLMFVTDGAVIPVPDAAQKIRIIQNAAELAKQLEIEMPKAALMAAVEAIYPAVPVTMEGAAIAKMCDRGQIRGVIVDGPLSFDVAISAAVAHSKGITDSQVAGDADIFAMPTMATADGVYKAITMYADARAAGIIYGARIPIAVVAETDKTENILNSIALAAWLA